MIPWVGFDLSRNNRAASACRQIGDLVGDDQWHSWPNVVAIVSAANGLQANTVSNLLYGMISTGALRRRGRYSRRRRHDGREVRRIA